jgi:hypothetical protein
LYNGLEPTRRSKGFGREQTQARFIKLKFCQQKLLIKVTTNNLQIKTKTTPEKLRSGAALG